MEKITKESVIRGLRDVLNSYTPLVYDIIRRCEKDGKKYFPELKTKGLESYPKLETEVLSSYRPNMMSFEEIKEAYFFLTLTYFILGEPDEGLCSLKNRMPLLFRERFFNYIKGLANIDRGNLKDALDDISHLNLAPKLSTKSPDVYYWLGYANCQINNYYFAKGYFDLAIEHDHEFEEAYLARGKAYFKLREEEKAIADFGKALELNPENEEARNYLGLVKDIIKSRTKF